MAPSPWTASFLSGAGSAQCRHGLELDALSERFSVPGSWNGEEGTARQEGFGYATFALRLHGLKEEPLGLLAERIHSSAALHFLGGDGRLLTRAEVGTVGTSADEAVGVCFDPLKAILFPSPSVEGHTFVLHMSNYHHPRGGLLSSVNLMSLAQYQALIASESFRAQVLFGILLIIGLYHLVLYAQRRDDRSTLFFGFFCLSVALRSFITELLRVSASEEYRALAILEYSSLPLMAGGGGLFLQAVLPSRVRAVFKTVVLGPRWWPRSFLPYHASQYLLQVLRFVSDPASGGRCSCHHSDGRDEFSGL